MQHTQSVPQQPSQPSFMNNPARSQGTSLSQDLFAKKPGQSTTPTHSAPPANPAMAAKMNTPQQDSFGMLNILQGKKK